MKRLAAIAILATTTGCNCFDAIEQAFPLVARPKAHAIVERESHHVATAANPHSTASGCWQIVRLHADLIPGGWGQRFDPWANTVAALRLSQGGTRWSPWAR